jgi:FixJ family two-component response regulator
MLTDVIMPTMSGSRLAERLAPLRPDMRVLYMSGYTDDVVDKQGILREGVELIQKPFTPAYLSRRVREFVSRSLDLSSVAA